MYFNVILLTNCYVSDLSWKYYFWWNLKQKSIAFIPIAEAIFESIDWYSLIYVIIFYLVQILNYNWITKETGDKSEGNQSLRKCVLKRQYFFTTPLSPLSPSFCLTPSSSCQFTLELPTLLIAPANSLWNWLSLNSDQNFRELTLLTGENGLKRQDKY